MQRGYLKADKLIYWSREHRTNLPPLHLRWPH